MTDDEIIKMALVHFGAVITPSDLEYKLAKLVANSAADELRRLDAENERLRADLLQAQLQCYAALLVVPPDTLCGELRVKLAEVKALQTAVLTEREACAKVCDELVLEHPGRADLTADQCAAAIRARNDK